MVNQLMLLLSAASRVFSSVTGMCNFMTKQLFVTITPSVFQWLQQHLSGISGQLPGLIAGMYMFIDKIPHTDFVEAKVSLDRIDSFLRNVCLRASATISI